MHLLCAGKFPLVMPCPSGYNAGVMKMLVFGGSGRTGQVMCRAAEAAGWQVMALTHAECDLMDAQAVADLQAVVLIADLNVVKETAAALSRPAALFLGVFL